LTSRWSTGVVRVAAPAVRTCADAGVAKQSAIRPPAMKLRRSRIFQSVPQTPAADKGQARPGPTLFQVMLPLPAGPAGKVPR
jgi:hypothetical protein